MNNRFVMSLVAIVCLLSVSTLNAAVYMWKDESGNTHFSERPAPNGQSELIDIKPSPAIPITPASATKPSKATAKPRQNKKVIMYSTSWCGYCRKARQHFKKNRIPFKEYDVEKLPSRMREFRKLGGTGYPLILVADEKMKGFSAKRFDWYYQKPQ